MASTSLSGLPLSIAKRSVGTLGSSPLGRPAAGAVAWLGRHGLTPHRLTGRTVDLLSRDWEDRAVYVALDLGGRPRASLELDLAVQGCRDLFVSPVDRLPDQTTLRLFCALARDASTVIDVGANAGLFTYLTAVRAPHARILSFEPTPRLAALIERNIARNGWQNRAEVRRQGASAAAGTMTLYLVAIDSESTLETGRARQRQVQDEIPIPVVALDDVVEAEGFVVADTLLKIDVEGHEMRVLDGLERTLRRHGARPNLIIEFLGKAIEEDGVIERILGLGLDVYYIASDSLVRIGSTADLARSHRLDHWNFLLTDRPIDVVRRATASARITLTDIS